MKKVLFVFVVLVMCGIVMVATPYEELQYNFPLDEGINKMTAAVVALIASILGAVMNIRKALLVWAGMILFMITSECGGIMSFSVYTIVMSLIMCAIVFIWADEDEEIKDFIMTLFKEEE